jgi:hypothetical protein
MSMPKPTTRAAVLRAALAASLTALLLLAACTGEPGTDDLLYEAGAVEGYVLAAGLGVASDINALSLDEGVTGWSPSRIQAQTRTDSTGWFRLELPTGRYSLDVDVLGNEFDVHSRPDTVLIGPSVLRHDLRRGLAKIRLLLPQEWEGQACRLQLDGESYNDGSVRVDVVQGWTEFVIPAVSPGAYSMRLTAPASAAAIYLPGTPDPAAADVLVVGIDAVAAYERDFTDSYVTVSGRVTGSSQVEPRLWVAVYAYTDGLRTVAAVDCDDDGRYQLVLPVPLVVSLRFSCGSGEQWYGGDTYGTAARIALQAGDRVTGIDLVESGLEVALHGPGDFLYRTVRIWVCDEAGTLLRFLQTTSNPTRIGLLRPGRVLVRLDGVCDEQTWAGQWFDGAASPSGATPLDLVAGERRRLDVVLAEGGRIDGRVLEADGLYQGSIQVELCDDRGEPWCGWPRYADEGRFTFTGLADGEYFLRVELDDGDRWWYPGTYEFAAAAAVGIVDHGVVTGLTWTLPARAGRSRR